MLFCELTALRHTGYWKNSKTVRTMDQRQVTRCRRFSSPVSFIPTGLIMLMTARLFFTYRKRIVCFWIRKWVTVKIRHYSFFGLCVIYQSNVVYSPCKHEKYWKQLRVTLLLCVKMADKYKVDLRRRKCLMMSLFIWVTCFWIDRVFSKGNIKVHHKSPSHIPKSSISCHFMLLCSDIVGLV